MAMSDYSSASDDEAPEVVSTSVAKKDAKLARREEVSQSTKQAAERKAKAKALAARRRAANKGKAKAVESEPSAVVTVAPDDDDDDDNGDDDSGTSGGEEDDVPEVPKKGTRTTFPTTEGAAFLDPALFASAASLFAPAAQPAAGTGKGAAKRAAKEEKRRQREREEQRRASIREGGVNTVGGLTLQHLATPTPNSSLMSASRTSHTTGAKFVASRLYSKKRVLAVADAGDPQPKSDNKRKKGTGGGGMSEESKMLLGLGMDDGSREASEAQIEEQAKQRKKKLLLQAEGRRKHVAMARPLKSARMAAPQTFAVATRTR